jgi:hypothetical protein
VEFFKLESIRGDGNCLFRALAAGVYNDQHQYKKLKEALLEYAQSRIRINDDDVNGIIRDRDIAVDLDIEDVPRFLHILTTDGEWGNQDHINCFMLRFNAPVFTWLEPKTEASADINADHPFEIARSKAHYAQALGPATDLWPLGPSKHVIHLLWQGSYHFSLLRPNAHFVATRLRSPNPSYTPLEPTRLRMSQNSATSDGSSVPEARINDILEDELERELSQFRNWETNSVLLLNSDTDDDDADISPRSSFQSQETSSASRKGGISHAQYIERVTHYNLRGEFERYMSGRYCCCDQQCVYLECPEDPSEIPTVHSSVIPDAVRDVIDTCRTVLGSMKKRKDIGDWLYKRLESGYEKTEEDNDVVKWRFRISYKKNGQKYAVSVCRRAFQCFYGISRSLIYDKMRRIRLSKSSCTEREEKRLARQIMNEDNTDRALTARESEVVAFIRRYCLRNGEHMPHTDEVRIAFHRIHVYEEYCEQFVDPKPNSGRVRRDGKPVCKSLFYELWNSHCADIISQRWKGDFAVCDECKTHAQQDHNPDIGNEDKSTNRRTWRVHLSTINACRLGYYKRRELAIHHPNEYMSIICDGSDSSNTYLPMIRNMSKSEAALAGTAMIKHKLMAVRVHAWNKRDYVYFAPPWCEKGTTCNLTLEAIARTLFKESETRKTDPTASWPRKLFVQLDNTSRDNKNHYVFAYFSYLVQKGIFRQVDINFLPVGHTHEDIDQLFSVVNRRMKTHDVFTFPQLQEEIKNAFRRDSEKVCVVEHVTALHDFKEWLEGVSQNAYKDYRSCVFHFRIAEDPLESNSGVSCQYLLYDYHEGFPDSRYMPYDDPPTSWLLGQVQGHPRIHESAGAWIETGLTTGTDQEPSLVDVHSVLTNMHKLFGLNSNGATTSDYEWWKRCLDSVHKSADVAARFGKYWQYSVPEPDEVNQNTSDDARDVYDFTGIDPIGPPTADILTFTNLTRTQRQELKNIEDETLEMISGNLVVNPGDFVVYLVEPTTDNIGRGLTQSAYNLPFAIGRVVRESEPTSAKRSNRELHEDQEVSSTMDHVSDSDVSDEGADEPGVSIEVFYQPEGDPNKRWKIGILEGRGQKKWIATIPHKSILCVNPEFLDSKSDRSNRTLSAKGCKTLAQTPRFPWVYIQGHGLVPYESAIAILNQKMETIINRNSVQGQRAVRKYEGTLRQLERLSKMKDRAIHRANASLLSQTSSVGQMDRSIRRRKT